MKVIVIEEEKFTKLFDEALAACRLSELEESTMAPSKKEAYDGMFRTFTYHIRTLQSALEKS